MNFSDLTLLINLFTLIAAIFASLYYKYYRESKEKYFLHFLWYTVITDTLGIYSVYYLKENWIVIYLVFVIVSFLFYFYWFHEILKSEKQKKIIKIFSILFICLSIYNLSTSSLYNFHFTTFIFGAIINIVISIFFFSQLLSDTTKIDVKENMQFWIATGLLLFNVGMVPIMIFSDLFNAYDQVRIIIFIILNFILYSCYTISFLWSKKEKS